MTQKMRMKMFLFSKGLLKYKYTGEHGENMAET
jgi:hypothetical protein